MSTIDLKKFSYGGITPLYATFESEYDNNGNISSSDDDENEVTQMNDIKEDKETTGSPRNNHTQHSYHQSLLKKSNKIKQTKQNRKRAVSIETYFAISNESFHHFRIHSIFIAHNKNINKINNNFNENINENEKTDDDNIETIGHHHSGTTIINDTIEQKILQKHRKPPPAPPRKPKLPPKPHPKQQMKLIEKEIIETEETYFRGLHTLLNELILPLFDEKMIDNKYFKQCTSNLPEILAFHETFLAQLVEAYEYEHNEAKNKSNLKHTSIAQVFNAVNKEIFVSLYVKYIQDYDKILDLFGTTFHSNKSVQIFLKNKRKERKPLTNYLILPVQRAPRYILLLTDLKKHTVSTHIDYKDIESALEFVEEITNEINERERKIEWMSQCLQIQESLTGLNRSIVDENRKFERQFVFIEKINNYYKHQRQFFVFNDILIITNKNWLVKNILNIRTIDIKILNVKVKKRNKNKVSNKSAKSVTFSESHNDGYSQFTMLCNEFDKTHSYISKTINDIIEFDKLIKSNRDKVWDNDFAKLQNTNSH